MLEKEGVEYMHDTTDISRRWNKRNRLQSPPLDLKPGCPRHRGSLCPSGIQNLLHIGALDGKDDTIEPLVG